MNLSSVEALISERKEAYLEQLFTILRQKSISTLNIGVRECAELLRETMINIGIEARLIETKGHPVVYGEICSDPDAFTLLIYGHYDVQPPGPLDEWLSDPFEPTVRDGRIYCRGVGDNKGQLVAQILAIKTTLDLFGKLPINVKFVFEGEEESSSKNLAPFVEEHKELLRCDLVYTSDGPMQWDTPTVLLGVRGMLCVDLTVKGASRDHHSGHYGNIAPNPAWKLIHLLKTMRDESGRVRIEGFYDNLIEPSVMERQLLQQLPFNRELIMEQEGFSELDMDGETYHRLLAMEPTFNICGITGGYGGEGIMTIIPAQASVKLDIRLVTDQEPADIFNKLCAHVKKHAPEVEVKYLGDMRPSRTPVDQEIVRVVVQAVKEAYEQEPIIIPSMGGSLPDFVWTKILGVPSIIVPYANTDEANHSPQENMIIDYFFNGIKCTCHLLTRLGEFDKRYVEDAIVTK